MFVGCFSNTLQATKNESLKDALVVLLNWENKSLVRAKDFVISGTCALFRIILLIISK